MSTQFMIFNRAGLVVALGLFLQSLASTVQAADVGFGNGSGWHLNRGGPGIAASFSGQQLTITTAGSNDSWNSAIYTTKQSTAHFTAEFTYSNGHGGDGGTFLLENDPRGTSAVSTFWGSGLGYGGDTPITNSVAVEIDALGNWVGLGINGNTQTTSTPGTISLASNHPIHVVVNYDGGTLHDTFTDTITGATYSTSYLVNIAQYTGANAYVGLSGGDGLSTGTQVFSNFNYSVPEPTSCVMFAVGGIYLLIVARRRKTRSMSLGVR
jgi:hypothetical protein